jgi:hypothetical protein
MSIKEGQGPQIRTVEASWKKNKQTREALEPNLWRVEEEEEEEEEI